MISSKNSPNSIKRINARYSVKSNITSIALIETKLYSKKNRYPREQILIRNSNKIDKDKTVQKRREEEFRDLKRSGSSGVQPAISIGLSSFPRRFPAPQGSSSCCKDIHSTLFGGGQRSIGCTTLLSSFLDIRSNNPMPRRR